MKKYLTLLLLALCALTLAGCGGGAPEKKASVPVKGRALVVYYSRADENSGVGYIEKGNTKILAEFIAKATGATVTEALEMYGTKAQNWKDEAKQETLAWLKKIGYEK